MDKIICRIRKIGVSCTPEELVRQKVLHLMIDSLGYPESGFAIEQSLHSMPHLQAFPKSHFPNRRADILFFGSNIHPHHSLYPLLLIECKAANLTVNAISQAISYNYYLQALMVAVAGKNELKVGMRQPDGQYIFESQLAPYNALKSKYLIKMSAKLA